MDIILSQSHITIGQIFSRFPSPTSFPPLYEIVQTVASATINIVRRNDAFDTRCRVIFGLGSVVLFIDVRSGGCRVFLNDS